MISRQNLDRLKFYLCDQLLEFFISIHYTFLFKILLFSLSHPLNFQTGWYIEWGYPFHDKTWIDLNSIFMTTYWHFSILTIADSFLKFCYFLYPIRLISRQVSI